jgi:hypothetical protein
MNIIKNEIKRLWDSGVAIETIVRSLPTTIVLARDTIKEMRLSGELKPRSKHEITRQKIEALFEKGYNKQQIASELAMSTRTVNDYLADMGIKGRPPKNYKPRKRSEKTHIIINELQKPQISYSEIARKYGVSRQYVYRIYKELNK